ncbi:uncharacterized protein KD926_007588 [Aspergillus affinis]|uniref:uncharacterized protein n=1 Tax=Aspergillus affinis TaxID=1070780 RepID=UPI0022FF1CE7|nr:uncharacterized protein KD926_007588 [Aspergillus affinis]KAI9040914.1 hypothetical protein KD926_007588 [Aspergillus affinis]
MLGIENQPNVHFDNHAPTHCEAAMLMEELGRASKPVGEWNESQRDQIMERFRFFTNSLLERRAAAEADNKILFFKDHPQFIWRLDARVKRSHDIFDAILPQPGEDAHQAAAAATNPTILPVECLTSSRVVISVRHPALSFPSVFRGHLELRLQDPENWRGELMRSWMTLSYSRVLYDWYRSYAQENKTHETPADPIIVGMKDLIDDPSLVSRLATSLGLDPSKVLTEWDTRSQPEDDRILRKVYSRSINQATGVLKEKAPDTVDLELEKTKWVKEFGEDAAAILADCVEQAMPDYEYLMAQRLR